MNKAYLIPIYKTCGYIESQQLDEELAIIYCKGTLIEELMNKPNRGFSEIISIYDSETKELLKQ